MARISKDCSGRCSRIRACAIRGNRGPTRRRRTAGAPHGRILAGHYSTTVIHGGKSSGASLPCDMHVTSAASTEAAGGREMRAHLSSSRSSEVLLAGRRSHALQGLFLRSLATLGLAGLLLLALGAMPAAEDPPRFSDWSAPVNLGPVVNTTFADAGAYISKDGLGLYLGSVRPGGAGAAGTFDIWVSHRASVDDPWGPPKNLGFSGEHPGQRTDSHAHDRRAPPVLCQRRPGRLWRSGPLRGAATRRARRF